MELGVNIITRRIMLFGCDVLPLLLIGRTLFDHPLQRWGWLGWAGMLGWAGVVGGAWLAGKAIGYPKWWVDAIGIKLVADEKKDELAAAAAVAVAVSPVSPVAGYATVRGSPLQGDQAGALVAAGTATLLCVAFMLAGTVLGYKLRGRGRYTSI